MTQPVAPEPVAVQPPPVRAVYVNTTSNVAQQLPLPPTCGIVGIVVSNTNPSNGTTVYIGPHGIARTNPIFTMRLNLQSGVTMTIPQPGLLVQGPQDALATSAAADVVVYYVDLT